ncbi:MAG TPA: tetratricopeptide repeat protein [Bacteroidales bacterium]|nr:tetratricopeptide repeat protein [Bacteroidales bacterium]
MKHKNQHIGKAGKSRPTSGQKLLHKKSNTGGIDRINAKKKIGPLQLIIIFLLPFLLYSQTISFGFTYFDDDGIIIRNIDFLSDAGNIPEAFLTDQFILKDSSFYRPLGTVSYMLDILLSGGNNPWMYHFTNVLLMSLIAVMFFIFLTQFNFTVRTALFGSLIFSVHPLFVSTVAFIPNRAELLVVLFSLMAFSMFIKSLASRKAFHLILHFAAFTLALFSKESAAFLPVLLLLYYFIFYYKKPFQRKHLLLVFVYLIPGVLWLWLRSGAINQVANLEEKFGLTALLYNLRLFPESLAKFAFPFDSAPIPQFSIPMFIAGIVMIAAIVYFLFKSKGKKKYINLFYLGWFIIIMLPPALFRHPYIDYLDHRFIFPFIGIMMFILTAVTDGRTQRSSPLFKAIPFMLIIAFACMSFIKTLPYSDPQSFYDSAVSKNPKSALAYNNRGFCVKLKNNDYDGAIQDFTAAISINPKYADVYGNRGFAYDQMKMYNLAVADFSAAIQLNPSKSLFYYDRGISYFNMHRYDSAVADLTKAIELSPQIAEYYYNRGIAYVNFDSAYKAITDFTKAIELKPDYKDAYLKRGSCYNSASDYVKAISDFNKVIQTDPGNADAYNNRAKAFVNSGKVEQGIGDYTKAIQLKPESAEYYNNRGIAYAVQGNMDMALSDFSKAIELNPSNKESYFNRGRVYSTMGLHEQANQDFLKAGVQ